MTTNTELVPFHEDHLVYVEIDGAPFVAAKPIAERLGLDWKAQHRRLSERLERYGIVVSAIPSAGGEQETSCIPVNRIALWLSDIQINKVAEQFREPLRLYQIEAADVLDRHFRQRREDEHEEVEVLRAMLQRSHGHLLTAMPRWAKIKLLHEADLWWTQAARRLGLSDAAFHAQVAEMQRCGILPTGPWEAGASADWFDRMRFLEAENRTLKGRIADTRLAAFEAELSAVSPPPEQESEAEG